MMAGSEPWITLGRGYEESLALLQDATREVYVAFDGGRVIGFVILNMAGAFVGYIQTICVGEADRSRGIGTRLMRFAEERIFRDSPNVFLCVSSFNPRARGVVREAWLRAGGRAEGLPREGAFGVRLSQDDRSDPGVPEAPVILRSEAPLVILRSEATKDLLRRPSEQRTRSRSFAFAQDDKACLRTKWYAFIDDKRLIPLELRPILSS